MYARGCSHWTELSFVLMMTQKFHNVFLVSCRAWGAIRCLSPSLEASGSGKAMVVQFSVQSWRPEELEVGQSKAWNLLGELTVVVTKSKRRKCMSSKWESKASFCLTTSFLASSQLPSWPDGACICWVVIFTQHWFDIHSDTLKRMFQQFPGTPFSQTNN